MNIQRQSFSTSEPCVLSAWREQLAQVTVGLSQQLVQQAPQLLPRFVAYYTKLQQLPRRVRRRLQWQFRRVRRAHHFSAHGTHPTRTQSLAGVALLLALGQAPALAATINVGGGCTLVNAINSANQDASVGGCTAGSGKDTIVLPAKSTQTLTRVDNGYVGPSGLPIVTSAITIAGNGSTIARNTDMGTPAFRIFVVGAGGGLLLQQTRVTGGSLSGQDRGGGVYRRSGHLTLAGCTISGNSAYLGGGVANAAGGTLTVTDSRISGNIAGQNGGGVENNQGSVTLTNSTVLSNTAGNVGGGLLNDSVFMSVANSTVSGNTAGFRGGGVYSSGRAGNLRSDVVLSRSLISGNTAPKGAEVYQVNGVVVSANSFNLFGHSGLTNAQALVGEIRSGVYDFTATLDGTRPTALASILNPTLANNGGLTQTHALTLGSPAVDAAALGCPPPNTDQRGVPRAQDANNGGFLICDSGAFELVPPGTVTCGGLPATLVGTGAAETITGTPGPDVIQGLGGNDVIRALGGNDVVCGGSGNDRLFGGPGDDRLFGDAGTDRLDGGLDFDRCDGGPPRRRASCEQVSNVP